MTSTRASAVLILSHGSRDPRAAYVVAELVAAISERTGREVRAAHLDFTAPTPGAALVTLANDGFRAVRLVPLLFTPGYHLTHDVPSAVAASGVSDRMEISVAPPLLSSGRRARQLMLTAMGERLVQAGADRHVDGLILASAGSSSDVARQHVESLARDLAHAHGIPVISAFASAIPPSPTQALNALSDMGSQRPAVASLFVAPGRLPDSVVARCPDIPVADPLGVSPAFVELLVAQARVLSTTT
jgi:sirohydrochlorin ferrochelatase